MVVAKRSLNTGLLGGAMQVAAYWIIVWALATAPMATVSAVRETSVLFAALIPTFLLREGFRGMAFHFGKSSNIRTDSYKGR